MTFNESYDLLSSLLPTTSYALAYALPLFLLSILLTFSGAFLTLDRTRIFPASGVDRQNTSKVARSRLSFLSWTAFLHGGLGGLCSGYVFGVYFTTLLALLIPNTTSSGPLSPKAFLAIWVLGVIFCAAIAGRWKYATIVLAAISGYATLALSFSVIAHPSLITRLVLLAVFIVLGTVASLLPFPRISHVASRLACSSAGAFGAVQCIAIFARNAAWGDVWERLWVHDGASWGTSQEKGLSAAYCLLLLMGFVCDWILHRKFGENPDEKWDHYLATYTENLPNDNTRAGTFNPATSWFDRLLGRDRYFAPIVADQKVPIAPEDVLVSEKIQNLYDGQEYMVSLKGIKNQQGFLRKSGSKRANSAKASRRAIKFQPGDEDWSSDSDEDEVKPTRKPFVPRSLSSASTATLTNSRRIDDSNILKPPSRTLGEIPDYSDYEEDLAVLGQKAVSRDDPNWTPEFIRRHSTRSITNPRGADKNSTVRTPSPTGSAQSSRKSTPTRTSGPPPLPLPQVPDALSSVPATPSLIRAVDRITAAYTAQAVPLTQADGLPRASSQECPGSDSQPWDSFWADVKAKAHS